MKCSICGGSEFSYQEILWKQLIDEWQLLSYEVDYINRQQGYYCTKCSSNLRSIALAKGILNAYDFSGTLNEFVNTEQANNLKVLEINQAGNLTAALSKLQFHRMVEYPDIDMMEMDIELGSYDLVVHSDTLEHVRDPVIALKECRRILRDKGRCIFTVPIIVDRLSRSRVGLAHSYHGNPKTSGEDFIVHTEFGIDIWKYAMKAGFNQFIIHNIEYPAGLSIEVSG